MSEGPMSPEAYQDLDGVSAMSLRSIAVSPLHWYLRATQLSSTPFEKSLSENKELVRQLLFYPGEFESKYTILTQKLRDEFANKNTRSGNFSKSQAVYKTWKKKVEEGGKQVADGKEFDRATEASSALANDPVVKSLQQVPEKSRFNGILGNLNGVSAKSHCYAVHDNEVVFVVMTGFPPITSLQMDVMERHFIDWSMAARLFNKTQVRVCYIRTNPPFYGFEVEVPSHILKLGMEGGWKNGERFHGWHDITLRLKGFMLTKNFPPVFDEDRLWEHRMTVIPPSYDPFGGPEREASAVQPKSNEAPLSPSFDPVKALNTSIRNANQQQS